MGAIAWKFKISPVSVGLQHQVDDSVLSWCSMHISKNGSLPFCSTSNVNFKFGCNELISDSLFSMRLSLIVLSMSSIYRSKSLASSFMAGSYLESHILDSGGAGGGPIAKPSIFR